MKLRKCLAVFLSAVLILSFNLVCSSAQSENSLVFGDDGKFTVLQITDPQDDRYPAYELVPFIEQALKTVNPDLVVFTGDIVEDKRSADLGKDDDFFHEGVYVEDIMGEFDYDATLENVKLAADAVFAPVEAMGIPFAVTQGNNDYKSGITNEDWLKIYASYPHCITVDQSDDEDGKIDSYVEILNHTTNEPAFGLWLLDNGRTFTDGQAKWFDEKETSNVPSIVFEHIPVSDIGNLFEKCSIFDSGAVFSSGKTYRLNHEIANGVYYTVTEPGNTSQQFTAWKNKGVVGAFFGHIHTDGYTGVWDGITLGVTYGCEFAKSGPYGVRTITISEDQSFETELYTYADNTFTLQQEVTYSEYSTKTEGLLRNFIALMRYLLTTVLSVLNLS